MIGFRFTTSPLLALIPELDSSVILLHLQILKKRGFLHVDETHNGETPKYSFEQLVMQQVIYNSVPASKRINYHCQYAEWYERRQNLQVKMSKSSFYQIHFNQKNGKANSVSVLNLNVALLGWHYREGKNYQKAMYYFSVAADNALAHFSPQDTIPFAEEALKLTEKISQPHLNDVIHLRRILGESCFFLGRHEECEHHLLSILKLAQPDRNWEHLNEGTSLLVGRNTHFFD